MTKPNLLTKSKGMWHFHAIGTGIIITYSIATKQLRLTNEATGKLEDCICMDFDTPEFFKEFVKPHYLKMLEDPKPSLNMSYYDKTTYVGKAKVEVDLKALLN